jgi:RHS repeat-associated protein
VRFDDGDLKTDRTYTGQRSYANDFGLMYYNARWYDPAIGRFAQADNIEITAGDIQSLDRFAYTLNNPIQYTDTTGHVVDPVTLGLIGGAIGFVGNVGFQMASSMISGESKDISQAFSKVDWKSAVMYGVAGAVAGATYGAATPYLASTAAGAAVAGGLSGLVSGQVTAVADATWDAAANVVTSEDPLNTLENNWVGENARESMGAFFSSAHDAGFMDPGQMAFDTGTGALLGGVNQGLKNSILFPGGYYATAAAAKQNTVLTGVMAGMYKSASTWAEELAQQWLDQKYSEIK